MSRPATALPKTPSMCTRGRCRREVVEGRNRCAPCIEQDIASHMRSYERKKLERVCVECDVKLETEEQRKWSRCLECRKYRAIRERERREAKNVRGMQSVGCAGTNTSAGQLGEGEAGLHQ